MDRYLRKLEREATDVEGRKRLAYAKLRAEMCLAHGVRHCSNPDCQVVSQIVNILINETDFLEKWDSINQILYIRGLQIHNDEIASPVIREEVHYALHQLLLQITENLGIFFPHALADEFIDYYKLADTPFCGAYHIQINGKGVTGLLIEALGWEPLVGAIYYPDYLFTPFVDVLDYRIMDKISTKLPPLEIEKVLQGFPYLEADVAGSLLEKGRAAHFMGESWVGQGTVAIGKNQRDWFNLRCERFPDCYDRDFVPIITDQPGNIFAEGTSYDITVRVNLSGLRKRRKRRIGSFIITQQFSSPQVTIIVNPELSFYHDIRDIASKLRKEGFLIKIDNGYNKRMKYRSNPWYDDILIGNLYRGTITGPPRSFGVGILGAGVYLTWDKRVAQGFANIYADRYDAAPLVNTYKIVPGLNILDTDSPVWTDVMAELGLNPWDKIGGQFFSNVLTQKLKDKGYDGVISRDPFDGLVIFDSQNVVGYVDPMICEKCQKRKIMCEKCGHLWCHTTCDAKFDDCPECSICKICGGAELEECEECGQEYCIDCDDDCPDCF